MPSSDPIQRFLDIVENIERINQYAAAIDMRRFSKAALSETQSNVVLSASVKPLQNWVQPLRSFARKSSGLSCAASETFCVTNMMESNRNVFGS